jgi:hypothetical protein
MQIILMREQNFKLNQQMEHYSLKTHLSLDKFCTLLLYMLADYLHCRTVTRVAYKETA